MNLEFIVNSSNAIAQVFSSDSSNFNFFEFQELFCRLKELSDDDQTLDETVVTSEDQMFLKLPSLRFLFSFEVVGQLLFELSKSGSKMIEDL